MSLSDTSFDPAKFRMWVASAILKLNLLLQFVEYVGIRACFEYLCRGLQPISRDAVKLDILELYELEKEKIKNLLAINSRRVGLTSDLCTAINGDAYLAITVHFIGKGWILRKYILCLS